MKINSMLSQSDDNEFVSYFITSLSLYCWPHINQFIDCKTASVAKWLRAWDTLTMFEATVCGRS